MSIRDVSNSQSQTVVKYPPLQCLIFESITLFEVFLYLLENYTAINKCPDAPTLARRLANEGFDEFEIRSAVFWVEQLRHPLTITQLHSASPNSTRIYHPTERLQLGDDNIALLTELQANLSISTIQREYIIERAMMLPPMMHRADVFKALLLTILWAHEHEINDMLLHALIDEMGDETVH